MKNILMLFLLFSFEGWGQSTVPAPKKVFYRNIDIHGQLQVREISNSSSNDSVLVVDTNGIIKKVSPNTIGDIKYGLQQSDHNGWVLLDGRLLSTLTTNQQAAIVSLGLNTSPNLPDATNTYLSQNNQSLGSVSGSNNKTLAQANLPNINFIGATSTNGNHSHTIKVRTGSESGSGNPYNELGAGFALNKTTESGGNHSHTVTVSSGGSNTPIDIRPLTLSINTFIYLGN